MLPVRHLTQSPYIVVGVDRSTYKGGKLIDADPKLDWAGNLAHMMGARALRTLPAGLCCGSDGCCSL